MTHWRGCDIQAVPALHLKIVVPKEKQKKNAVQVV